VPGTVSKKFQFITIPGGDEVLAEVVEDCLRILFQHVKIISVA
jgi:hypothetical protein